MNGKAEKCGVWKLQNNSAESDGWFHHESNWSNDEWTKTRKNICRQKQRSHIISKVCNWIRSAWEKKQLLHFKNLKKVKYLTSSSSWDSITLQEYITPNGKVRKIIIDSQVPTSVGTQKKPSLKRTAISPLKMFHPLEVWSFRPWKTTIFRDQLLVPGRVIQPRPPALAVGAAASAAARSGLWHGGSFCERSTKVARMASTHIL